jgi:hypothetical protein
VLAAAGLAAATTTTGLGLGHLGKRNPVLLLTSPTATTARDRKSDV